MGRKNRPALADGPSTDMTRSRGFLDPADYPFVKEMERNAAVIRSELDELLLKHPFQPFRHRPNGDEVVYEKGWDVFGFYGRGKKVPVSPSICPRTRELIEAVPDIVTAGFSKLAGGARVFPHAGKKDLIRCHLGLIIPPECWFRVGDEVTQWKVNKCLLFDNTVEHEAWNDSLEDRIIFVVDFVNHGRAVPANGDAGAERG